MNVSTSAGAPISVSELSGFTLTERWHEPDWMLAPHAHEVTILGVTLAGCFQEAVGKRRHECAPGSLQILPAGESHAYQFGSSRVHCRAADLRRLPGEPRPGVGGDSGLPQRTVNKPAVATSARSGFGKR